MITKVSSLATTNVIIIIIIIIIEVQQIPLQAWVGPEGSRRLKLPDFKTIGT